MSLKIPLINQIREQIESTLKALSDSEIIYNYNVLRKTQLSINRERLSWVNHKTGKFNTNSEFLKLNQYRQILMNNSYLCIIYDGSIIRVSYTFENNVLIGHNLLWWPAPYNYKGIISLDEISPHELIDEFLAEKEWYKSLDMRTPIRVDYDPIEGVVSEKHPPTHLHMQHGECRMYVDGPLCFNRFMKFILTNYYANIAFEFNSRDNIIFNDVRNGVRINYSNAEIRPGN